MVGSGVFMAEQSLGMEWSNFKLWGCMFFVQTLSNGGVSQEPYGKRGLSPVATAFNGTVQITRRLLYKDRLVPISMSGYQSPFTGGEYLTLGILIAVFLSLSSMLHEPQS